MTHTDVSDCSSSDGSLLIECATEHHSKCLLKSKILCIASVNVSAHLTLNSPKGVIGARDLEGIDEEVICQNICSKGVSSVRRIKARRNNELVPTNTLILTFDTPDFCCTLCS